MCSLTTELRKFAAFHSCTAFHPFLGRRQANLFFGAFFMTRWVFPPCPGKFYCFWVFLVVAPALFCVVLLFFLLAKRKSGGEICVSSLFCPVFVWFLICLEIVELRCFICLQFVYPLLSLLGPSLRAKSAATEGKKILCEVMQACRSGNPETLHSASIMTRSMQDLSEDEDSPLHQMSLIQVSNEMDAAERVFDMGQGLQRQCMQVRAATTHLKADMSMQLQTN